MWINWLEAQAELVRVSQSTSQGWEGRASTTAFLRVFLKHEAEGGSQVVWGSESKEAFS